MRYGPGLLKISLPDVGPLSTSLDAFGDLEGVLYSRREMRRQALESVTQPRIAIRGLSFVSLLVH